MILPEDDPRRDEYAEQSIKQGKDSNTLSTQHNNIYRKHVETGLEQEIIRNMLKLAELYIQLGSASKAVELMEEAKERLDDAGPRGYAR